ncbi:MAG: DUF192 domain-containing protein [Aquificaceae bacterium]|jgi:uncharacterized membrane protein (UPF0127 family)|uniref:DUF192 domain-containing protein n=1 Tax=Hydrogenobacter sp. Uz 6-8 TaxID=3384828 RepID=UPI000F1DEB04|nr:MAG: DUF192 domain-containing protein [Aquificota bacterium]
MLIIFNIILFLITYATNAQVHQCRLLVADTPEKHERGLMHLRSFVGYDGMVFLYRDRAIRHFWNRNTHLELDLYWIDRGRLVGRSYLPPEEKAGTVVVSSPQPVDTVVELIRGRKCMYRDILLSP